MVSRSAHFAPEHLAAAAARIEKAASYCRSSDRVLAMCIGAKRMPTAAFIDLPCTYGLRLIVDLNGD